MGEGVVRPDQVSLGVLVAAVSRDAVDDAVAVCGAREKRSDAELPAHAITYLTLALCLFPEDGHEEVATRVSGSLDRWNCWNAAWTVPTASAATQARKRLGRSVFPGLFERTCGPVAGEAGVTAEAGALGTARGSLPRRWRLLAIDGFDVDVPGGKQDAAEFGYAGSGDNRSASPEARVVALAERGTHAFVAAEVDAHAVGGRALARRLCPRLRADELPTADRGFYSWQAWDAAAATGAALLWRAPT
ncbi:MAG: transposase domain-containing protein, partial [Haloechinothrix sp.]